MILESDSLRMSTEINSQRLDLSLQGNGVEEIRSMHKIFKHSKVSHIGRIGNEPAQKSALYAWYTKDMIMWLLCPSIFHNVTINLAIIFSIGMKYFTI